MMEKVIICPLCGKKNNQFRFKKGGRSFFECLDDKLVFVAPQPSEKELGRLYNERYFESEEFRGRTCIGYYAYLHEKPLLVKYFKKKLGLIEKMGGRGKILDVGCGHGFFLDAAKELGWEAEGIDISGYAVEYAQEQGHKVWLKELAKARFKTGSFGIVTIFQTIEHVCQPKKLMKEIARILKPGGMVVLTTPNQGGYLRKLMGKQWLSYRHQEHLCFFSTDSMRALLIQAGLERVSCFKDETRFYPWRHVLGGVKYYFKGNFLKSLADGIGTVSEKLKLLDVKLPLPLDTLVGVAFKPR